MNETISTVCLYNSSSLFSRVETVASVAFGEGMSLDTRRNLQSIFSCDPVIFFDVELFPMG